MSLAFHEPQKIEDVLKPSLRELASRVEQDPDAFEQDDWWKSQ
jgi:hypothetical protein